MYLPSCDFFLLLGSYNKKYRYGILFEISDRVKKHRMVPNPARIRIYLLGWIRIRLKRIWFRIWNTA